MIDAARHLIEAVTPLRQDCGALCGRACCASNPDDPSGMILFPGEERLYDPAPDWAQTESIEFEGLRCVLLRCIKPCPRDMRPLACRIFPLTPIMRGCKASLRMDRRAFSICPLAEHGIAALDRAFVSAVKEATRLLATDHSCRMYLAALADRQERISNWSSIVL
ncbi:MAG: hypothetical protein LBS72_04500 [Oscillospiraceae bacterium]|jgi:hypothetical protein|nr:hypothetical protein [Oscillospiraceae bacterium]